MISAIRNLAPDQQRQLIGLLEPPAGIDEITAIAEMSDDEVLAELLAVLRRVLEVPEKDDLPEYMRRRLVEVASRQFELRDDTDRFNDMELARELVDFVLDAAVTLADDQERRDEFETFLRTKSKRERLAWLVASQRIEAFATDGTFDRAAAKRRAESLNQGSGTTALGVLSALTVARAGAAAGVAAAPALAIPLSALAGGLYMAGRHKRNLTKAMEEDVERSRAQRARRSKLVQSVVVLCAFLVVSDPSSQD